MDELVSLITLEPWNRFTGGLVAALFVARLLDFLSTWVVTPRLELEANPLMGWMRWGRTALTIPTQSFQEQGVTGTAAGSLWMVPAEGTITAQRDGRLKQYKNRGQVRKVWMRRG